MKNKIKHEGENSNLGLRLIHPTGATAAVDALTSNTIFIVR